MRIQTLCIVGVGLIGGSIGLAVKSRGLADRVIGVGRRPEALDRALGVGAIDAAFPGITEAVHEADLAIFCTPVTAIVEQVLAAAPACRPGTLLTDAGSAKAVIVRTLESRLPKDLNFVGAHPLAGSERSGPEHASANLFQNKVAVVTRTAKTDSCSLERISALWSALGARVHVMNPEEHDSALAMTSHLPHVVSAALVGVLPPDLADFTATGFRDTTRIASGDPALWTGIFLQNRQALLAAVSCLGNRLREFRTALDAGDGAAIKSLLEQARKVRDALGNRD
jgi:prephenate dehydrogenase